MPICHIIKTIAKQSCSKVIIRALVCEVKEIELFCAWLLNRFGLIFKRLNKAKTLFGGYPVQECLVFSAIIYHIQVFLSLLTNKFQLQKEKRHQF